MKRLLRAALPAIASALAACVPACAGPPGDDRVSPVAPAYELFRPAVGDVIEAHCGTLDCHGSVARNLRVYGFYGARLDPSGLTGEGSATEAEYAATYEAVISIQPEILAEVVRDRGTDPERWIFVTKSRGTEEHEGGKRLPRGSDGDRCILSWLAGAIDQVACQNSAGLVAPGGEAW